MVSGIWINNTVATPFDANFIYCMAEAGVYNTSQSITIFWFASCL
jgi:hypothetical protein